MQLVGFLGKKRHGKDTAGDHLVKKYGFTKRCFATPLKDIARIAFSLSEEQLYGDLKEQLDERWNKTPRQLLQYLGTDVFRNKIDKNFWINHMKLWINTRMEKINDQIALTPLEQITQIAFLLTNEQMMNVDGLLDKIDERWNKTPAQLTNLIKTLFITEFVDQFWDNVDALKQDVEQEKEEERKNVGEFNLVITDLRFPNEVEMVKQLGGTVYKVVRPQLAHNNVIDEHISEKVIDEIDFYDTLIINDSTLEDFYEKLDANF